jgi:hypothetical protein
VSALVGRSHSGSHCFEDIDLLDANGERLTLEHRAIPVRGHGVSDSYFIQGNVSQHHYDVVAVVAPWRVGTQLGLTAFLGLGHYRSRPRRNPEPAAQFVEPIAGS